MSPIGQVAQRLASAIGLLALCLSLAGCVNPIGANKTTPARSYRQTRDNPISHSKFSAATLSVLHRFEQDRHFDTSPDATLQLLHQKAVDSGDRSLLFALSELNYVSGERLRHSVKPWEPRDARDYYLASAVYAWLFLFSDAAEPKLSAFDQRFRTACDLYNYGLGWALSEKHGTNAIAKIEGGLRRFPTGALDIELQQDGLPWESSRFERFVLSDHFIVRGVSVINRQAGLGAPLIAVSTPEKSSKLQRTVPVTALLRVNGNLADFARKPVPASLELRAISDDTKVQLDGKEVPLETDSTVAMAYALNQSFVWKLGMMQFLSSVERIPTDIYLTQPYQRGRIPVVFVHGTFSSPVWWAEMMNSLMADPVLIRRYQFWYFIYNSGNPVVYSAGRLRASLKAKLQELDPQGQDAALSQMVVIGHSQGGLLTKLTATHTGDKLLETVLKTNSTADLKISAAHLDLLRRYACYEPLPFVKRVVFISTPHRGSYAAGGFLRTLARKLVRLPSAVVKRGSELSGLTEKLNLPAELRGSPTSLDGMSIRNPVLLALADIPIADGVKANSIIAVRGNGDFHQGKDGIVAYQSAHVDYAESEFIVRSFHSCLGKPPTIEEVRRILHQHLKDLPAGLARGSQPE